MKACSWSAATSVKELDSSRSAGSVDGSLTMVAAETAGVISTVAEKRTPASSSFILCLVLDESAGFWEGSGAVSQAKVSDCDHLKHRWLMADAPA